MTALIFALVAFAASLISLGLSLTVALRPRVKTTEELQSVLRQQQVDLSELFDRVEHWVRRDRVRNLRDGKERKAVTEAEEQLPLAVGPDGLTKSQLRELAGIGG